MNETISKKQTKTRKKYSPQFKDQAVERAVKDGVPQASKDLGIEESMLYYWRSQKNKGGDAIENQKLQQAEMARLKREVIRLEEENAFLKKVATSSQKNRLRSFLCSSKFEFPAFSSKSHKIGIAKPS